jgi:hypothetical protein
MKIFAASIIAAACLAITSVSAATTTTSDSSSYTVVTATKTSTITVPVGTTITVGVPTIIPYVCGNTGNALQAVNAKAALAVGAGIAVLAQFL